MPKRIRDDQLVTRVAAPLKGAMEVRAAEEGRELSNLTRQILINDMARWISARADSVAAKPGI